MTRDIVIKLIKYESGGGQRVSIITTDSAERARHFLITLRASRKWDEIKVESELNI